MSALDISMNFDQQNNTKRQVTGKEMFCAWLVAGVLLLAVGIAGQLMDHELGSPSAFLAEQANLR